jgi:hypothetical protein
MTTTYTAETAKAIQMVNWLARQALAHINECDVCGDMFAEPCQTWRELQASMKRWKKITYRRIAQERG